MSRNTSYDESLKVLSDKLQNTDFSVWFGENVPVEDVKSSANNITSRMLETYESKDADYSENDLPMGNFRESVELGVQPWVGVILRIGDKKRRIGSFIQRSVYLVADEGVDDTLIDASNYALIGKVLYDEWAKDQEARGVNALFQEIYKLGEEFMSVVFIDLAFYSVLSKLLYEYKHIPGVSSWKEKPWEELNISYSKIAQFAKSANFVF